MRPVDINSDVGEWDVLGRKGSDDALLRCVTSANIACGYHAGSPAIMAATVALCKKRGVGIGAHPSFPDRRGFGRRRTEMDPDDLYHLLVYQVGALDGLARALGTSVFHVKAHGALYNMAWKRKDYADAIAKCAKLLGKTVLAPVGSMMESAARASEVRFASEAFVDRGYRSDGTLAPRGKPGALISDPTKAAERALQILDGSPIATVDDQVIEIEAQSLCVHSDTPGAPLIARAVVRRLKAAGFHPVTLREIL